MQTFGARLFLSPEAVIKDIERKCRVFGGLANMQRAEKLNDVGQG